VRRLLLLAVLPGCLNVALDIDPPKSTPYFPVSMAIDKDVLAIVSNDADRRYQTGNVILVDLLALDAEIDRHAQQNKDPRTFFIDPASIVLSSAFIPPLAQEASFIRRGDIAPLLIASAATDSILNLEQKDKKLFCEGRTFDEDLARPCDVAPNYAPVSRAPILIKGTPKRVSGIDGVIGFAHEAEKHSSAVIPEAPEIQVFKLSDDGKNLELGTSFVLGKLLFEKELLGKTTEEKDKLRKENSGVKEQVRLWDLHIVEMTGGKNYLFAAIDQIDRSKEVLSIGRRAKIVWIPLEELTKDTLDFKTIGSFDLTEATGSGGIRGIDIAPGLGTRLQVLAALRQPDLIARVDVSPEDNGQSAFLQKMSASVCELPLKIVSSKTSRIGFATCEGKGNAVLAFNTGTLRVTAINRDFGRGPGAIILDDRSQKPKVIVAYWLDGSLGVFSPINLKPIARVFPQAAPNRDGGL